MYTIKSPNNRCIPSITTIKQPFRRTGYLKHIKEYTEPVQSSPSLRRGEVGADDADLTSKVVVVTGANSGLGKMVSTYCAAKGARLYMICRDKDRGEKARQEIIQETSADSTNVQVLLADVGELSQVRKVAAEIQEKENKIHAVVCNAGVLLNDRQVTSEKNEVTFACHLLGGTYLLSSLLLPQLQAADDKEGRVVIVTSGGMYNSAIPSWDVMTNSNPEKKKYDGTMAYTYAKRGQVVLAEEWTKQYPDVTFVTVHPGWSDTPAVTEAFGDSKKYLEPLREPWEGAEGVAWLVQAKRANITSGELYLDRKTQVKHLAGPFMSEGTFTKNSKDEISAFLDNLKKAAGL